jgi:hypothetical protein
MKEVRTGFILNIELKDKKQENIIINDFMFAKTVILYRLFHLRRNPNYNNMGDTNARQTSCIKFYLLIQNTFTAGVSNTDHFIDDKQPTV